MPGQQGLRRHDHGHLRQKPATEPFRLGRQTTPLVVVEPKPPATKLFFDDPILVTKIVEGELLLLIHPASHGDQQEPEWVENSLRLQSQLSRAPGYGREPLQIHADPVSGPYQVGAPTQRARLFLPLGGKLGHLGDKDKDKDKDKEIRVRTLGCAAATGVFAKGYIENKGLKLAPQVKQKVFDGCIEHWQNY